MTFRILILNDDSAVREVLRSALADPAYELEEAPLESTSLAHLQKYRPHVVLSDVAIPDGMIPFLERVQTLTEPPMVILIADAGSRSAAVEALRAGAYDYIVKPLFPEQVAIRVSRAIERKRSFEEVHLQLIQSEKMASLGRLVAGIAHEINTPIGAIHSNSDVLRRVLAKLKTATEVLPSGAQQQEILQFVEMLSSLAEVDRIACERIAAVVRNLKTFARLDEAERKMVDVHEGLDSTLRLVEYALQDRIRVEKDYRDVPMIECYPNQLSEVFMNLLVNAAEAIEGSGVIRIGTRCNDQDVVIQISDTGKGIPADDLSKIFEPGFTTKGVGVGTGLGLSLVYKIIKAHAGTITAESELGRGTTFTITLPVP